MGDRGRCDIVVVGGGIVGRTAAWALSRTGRAVTLIDSLDPHPGELAYGASGVGPASFGNAGHLATEQVQPLAHPSFLLSAPRRLFALGGALDFGWRRPGAWMPWAGRLLLASARAPAGERALAALLEGAMPAWQRLAASLGQEGLVRSDGHLMLWQEPGAFQAGAASWSRKATGSARVRPLADAEFAAVAAHLGAPVAGGIRLEHTGQVSDPVEVMRLLRERFVADGGKICRARAIRLAAGVPGIVLDEGAVLWAPQVLLAAGVDTRRLLRGIGTNLPLVAERGYHLEWRHGTDWDLPPVVFEERAVIVSRFGDRLRASSFVEFDREDAPPDPRKWVRLERHVNALGLPVASPRRRWMGARPTLPDYLPAIGAVAGHPGLFVATGHGHLGLTLAPRTAEMVVALMGGDAVPELGPFDPGRWGRHRTAA